MTLKNVMDTWTLQQGYPFIHVNYAEGSWNIYQQKFTLNSETNKEPNFMNLPTVAGQNINIMKTTFLFKL